MASPSPNRRIGGGRGRGREIWPGPRGPSSDLRLSTPMMLQEGQNVAGPSASMASAAVGGCGSTRRRHASCRLLYSCEPASKTKPQSHTTTARAPASQRPLGRYDGIHVPSRRVVDDEDHVERVALDDRQQLLLAPLQESVRVHLPMVVSRRLLRLSCPEVAPIPLCSAPAGALLPLIMTLVKARQQIVLRRRASR